MPMAKKKTTEKSEENVICRNRKAQHRYNVLDTLEAGLVLQGSEVKSLRNGKASIEEAYVRVDDGEVWLVGADIPIYAQASRQNHDPRRRRKLLLHRREIAKFAGRASQRGFTLIPLKLYFHRGRAKLLIAVAQGRKTVDRREAMKKQDARREMERATRRRR